MSAMSRSPPVLLARLSSSSCKSFGSTALVVNLDKSDDLLAKTTGHRRKLEHALVGKLRLRFLEGEPA